MSPSVRKIIDWIGGHPPHVLISLLIVVGGIWAFVELADEVVEGGTQRFDEWAVRALRRPDDPARPIGPAWFTQVARDVTALGGESVLTLVTAAVVGFLWLTGESAMMWLVLGASLSGLAVSYTLKALFDRPRPDVAHLAETVTASFPSGHSMMSAVVYLTLGTLLASAVSDRRLKFYFLTVAVLLTGLVGLSRIYLGVHYPTDVLAGWTAGLVWAVLCWQVAQWLRHRGALKAGSLDK